MSELRFKRFLDAVVYPNFVLAVNEPDNERHMANAVLTLDACIGLLHRDLLDLRPTSTPKRDEEYRRQLALKVPDYRILRDLAAAYKHGELTGKVARLVSNISQLSTTLNVLGFFECGDELGGDILVIETSTGEIVRATNILYSVIQIPKDLLQELNEANDQDASDEAP